MRSLPTCKVIRDGYGSYFQFSESAHGLCNTHHLSELAFVYEQCNQTCTQELARLLVEIKDSCPEDGQPVLDAVRMALLSSPLYPSVLQAQPVSDG